MERSITGRDGYLQEKALAFTDALAQRLGQEEAFDYWIAYNSRAGDEAIAFTMACAITEIQARPDDQPGEWPKPWSDCQDMTAILCNLLPAAADRDRLADEIEQLTGLRPDFTDDKAGDVVEFPKPGA